MIRASQGDHELLALEESRRSIAEATSVELVKEIRDKAEAVRQYLKLAHDGLENQNKAAAIRLQADRRLGELLKELHLHGGDRRSSAHGEHLNLEKIGIDRNHSRRWQQIAEIPTELLNQYLSECMNLQIEITTTALLRFARHHMPQRANNHGKSNTVGMSKIAAGLSKLVREGAKFACISVYPPWPDQQRVGRTSGARRSDRRFLKKLSKLPIPDLAAESCYPHVWTTSDQLRNAVRIVGMWRFTYRSVLTCLRTLREYGDYYRTAQEFVLLGTKGNRTFQDNSQESVIDSNHTSTRSVEQIRQVIERVSVSPYLEVFGNGRPVGRTVISE